MTVLGRVDEPADAVLLIGDAAIRALTSGSPYPRITDLGIEWTEWTGIAFRLRPVGREHARSLVRAPGSAGHLDRALDEAMASLPEIARRRRDTGWNEAEVEAYLRGFNYRLKPRRTRGCR